jgi:signal transduction histidine kinase
MSDDPPFARPIIVLAFAAMIIPTVVGNLLFDPAIDAAPVIALAIPYALLATIGWWWSERRGGVPLTLCVVALHAITIAIVWVSRQDLMLLVVSPLLLASLYGGAWWGAAGIVGFTAIAAAQNVGAGLGAVEVYSRSTGFVPGAILTVAFAYVLRRERTAQRALAELAATRERNRIARDIHDSVGHYLTVVHVQLEAARAIVASDPAAADECLTRAQTLARDGLGELRRSVSMLRAPSERPFGASLAQLVGELRQAGLDASLAIEGAPRALGPAVEYALYRAVQEGLTNVAKHARAKNARCTLRYVESEVRLRVEDDGVGAVSSGGGFGLSGMRERLAAVGGSVEVRTAPGKGFTLDVRVPT